MADIAITHSSLTNQNGGASPLPFLIEASSKSVDLPLDELLAWMIKTEAWREEHLHRAGAILIRGFKAIRSAEDFGKVAKIMAPEILDYIGGTTPRSAVAGKIVTSTDAPRHAVIGLHQEMSYLAPSKEFLDPTPDKVMFFCETAPGRDGQTPIVDMRTIYNKLPQGLVDRFQEKGGLVLHRKLPAEKRYGYEVTWSTAFGASDRSDMDRIVKKNGWMASWENDGGLKITHNPSPIVKTHRVTGETVWFNQAHLLHKSVAPWTAAWLGPGMFQRTRAKFMKPFIHDRFYYHSTFADESEITEDDIRIIRNVIAKEMVLFDWQKSDVLLIDNKLVAHGRQPYSPPRTIYAALLADMPRRPAA